MVLLPATWLTCWVVATVAGQTEPHTLATSAILDQKAETAETAEKGLLGEETRAIFGPKSKANSEHIKSISGSMETRYIKTTVRPNDEFRIIVTQMAQNGNGYGNELEGAFKQCRLVSLIINHGITEGSSGLVRPAPHRLFLVMAATSPDL